MMKVLIINGSPKKDNSDVMHVTNSFINGMKQAREVEVSLIHTVEKNIKYCTGCLSCMRNGGTCILDDDMKDILNQILNTDVVVFSFPLYCYGMPASLKAIIDRILPLSSIQMREENGRYVHDSQKGTSHLKFVMICGCGFPNSKKNFEPAVLQFKYLFRQNNLILTIPETPIFAVPQAIGLTQPKLELVKEAGKQYVIDGFVKEELIKNISLPMIPEEQYAAIVNKQE